MACCRSVRSTIDGWMSSTRVPRPAQVRGALGRLLSADARAVRAPGPAAGPALAFFQLLLGAANASFSGHFPLGILDPADELVAGQRRDVLPGIERRGVGDQRVAQVSWQLVHHPTGHSRAAHTATVAGRGSCSHKEEHTMREWRGRVIVLAPLVNWAVQIPTEPVGASVQVAVPASRPAGRAGCPRRTSTR